MAKDFISINPTSVRGTALRNAIQTLRTAQEQLQRELDIMNHNNDGTDFAPIESLYGLVTGNGQTVFNYVNGTLGSMKGTFQVADATTITQRVG